MKEMEVVKDGIKPGKAFQWYISLDLSWQLFFLILFLNWYSQGERGTTWEEGQYNE